jgi:hypothetical protein
MFDIFGTNDDKIKFLSGVTYILLSCMRELCLKNKISNDSIEAIDKLIDRYNDNGTLKEIEYKRYPITTKKGGVKT